MSDLQAHKRKAERFLQSYLDAPTDLIELKLIALFYTAVHLVEMVASFDGQPSHRDHRSRNDYLRAQYPGAWKHYRPLFDASHTARYVCSTIPWSKSDLEAHFRNIRFVALQKWAVERLGEAGRLSHNENQRPGNALTGQPTTSGAVDRP